MDQPTVDGLNSYFISKAAHEPRTESGDVGRRRRRAVRRLYVVPRHPALDAGHVGAGARPKLGDAVHRAQHRALETQPPHQPEDGGDRPLRRRATPARTRQTRPLPRLRAPRGPRRRHRRGGPRAARSPAPHRAGGDARSRQRLRPRRRAGVVALPPQPTPARHGLGLDGALARSARAARRRPAPAQGRAALATRRERGKQLLAAAPRPPLPTPVVAGRRRGSRRRLPAGYRIPRACKAIGA